MSGIILTASQTETLCFSRSQPGSERRITHMIATRYYRYLAAALVLLPLASATWELLAGTKESAERRSETNSSVTSESGSQLSGQELWSMNCQRCHNMRSPIMYNATQWQVIFHHMRIR